MHDNEYCYEDDHDLHAFEASEQIKERKVRIIHTCDDCNTEIDGEFCAEHPNASISSIRVTR